MIKDRFKSTYETNSKTTSPTFEMEHRDKNFNIFSPCRGFEKAWKRIMSAYVKSFEDDDDDDDDGSVADECAGVLLDALRRGGGGGVALS